jgi:hypothetical protein
MKVMYAYRTPGGTVIRLDSEEDARRYSSQPGYKYIGKVKISYGKLHITNADPKKRGSGRRKR